MEVSIWFFDDEYADAAIGALCKNIRTISFCKASKPCDADICIDRYYTVSELTDIIRKGFAPDTEAPSIRKPCDCRLVSVCSASGGSGSSSICRLLKLGLEQLLEKKAEILNFSVFDNESGFNELLLASFKKICSVVEKKASESDILVADVPPYHSAWESIIAASDVVILNKGYMDQDSPVHGYLQAEIGRLNPDAQTVVLELYQDEFIDTADMSCQTGRQVYEIIKKIGI